MDIFKDRLNILKDKSCVQMIASVEKLTNTNDDNEEDKISDIIKNKKLFNDVCDNVDDCYMQNDDVYKDTEFFTQLSDKATSVFSNIHNCSTYGGKNLSELIYRNPICDIDMLNQRADCLSKIENIYKDNKDETNKLLETLKDNEKHIAWLLEEKDETVKDLYSMVFFRLKGLQPLNNYGSALTSYNFYRIIVSPLFGFVAPIVYFLIPYIIVLYKFKIRIPFTTYIKTMVHSVFSASDTLFGTNKVFKYARIISYVCSAMFYFQGIFTSIDVSKTVNKMCNLIITNFNCIIEYLTAAQKLIEIYWNSSQFSSYVKWNDDPNETKFIKNLQDTKDKYKVFSNFGNQLKAYKYLDVNILSQILKKSYILDSLIGAIKYKISRSFCISQYINEGKPVIHFEGVVHPCISCDKAVENDVRFGVIDTEQNAIVTSPNSSGKSILIKSIIVNVIMSQTMGICCSKKGTITPFRYITTQINVPDSTGQESLFEAEMYRCKNTLDKLKYLHSEENNNYSLVVMDEIFNSTNPIEAVAGAYAVCKKITSFKSNILIFTTHLGYLTKLAKDTDCKFCNYRMETKYNSINHNIVFSYKFEKGVNKYLLALELLKKSGFEDEIIDEAIKIKNKLSIKK
jgi:DNA mismatch repair ATPase MutS